MIVMNKNCLYAECRSSRIFCIQYIHYHSDKYQLIYNNAQIPVPKLLLITLNSKQDW